MVARSQTIQVYGECMDLDPKLRTVGQFHSVFSSLNSRKVILGGPLVSKFCSPSMVAIYMLYTERCHQNLPCPSELAQQAHPRKNYPSWTLFGRIFNHTKAEAASVSGNDMLDSLEVWLWPWSWITGATQSPAINLKSVWGMCRDEEGGRGSGK